MSFKEVTEEETESGDADAQGEESGLGDLDLLGIPKILHGELREMAKTNRAATESRDIPAARCVHVNQDGSIAVTFVVPVKVDGEEHVGVRMRPIKARDYFDGTTEAMADDMTLAGTMRFAAHLASPKRIIGEIACTEDMNAVYFGVMAARKNFSRPRR